ncbi:DUF6233 domain-containing protein [Streptomyces sp. NPDC051546]|uniref:DUF6233 domain-containing protein n=1 Tax=Streptomyces sp. NPDC051546 TaxID=3365655 RepID=UPI003798B757
MPQQAGRIGAVGGCGLPVRGRRVWTRSWAPPWSLGASVTFHRRPPARADPPVLPDQRTPVLGAAWLEHCGPGGAAPGGGGRTGRRLGAGDRGPVGVNELEARLESWRAVRAYLAWQQRQAEQAIRALEAQLAAASYRRPAPPRPGPRRTGAPSAPAGRPTPPDWKVKSRRDRNGPLPMSVHVGACTMGEGQTISRGETRRLITEGVEACAFRSPENPLGLTADPEGGEVPPPHPSSPVSPASLVSRSTPAPNNHRNGLSQAPAAETGAHSRSAENGSKDGSGSAQGGGSGRRCG